MAENLDNEGGRHQPGDGGREAGSTTGGPQPVRPKPGPIHIHLATPTTGANAARDSSSGRAAPPEPQTPGGPVRPTGVTHLHVEHSPPLGSAPSHPSPAVVAAARAACPASPPAVSVPVGDYNLGRGLLGALLGAVVGSALCLGLGLLFGVRTPLCSVLTGYLAGFSGKTFYGGADPVLGLCSGGIAAIAISATVYFLTRDVSAAGLVALVVGVAFAYLTASD